MKPILGLFIASALTCVAQVPSDRYTAGLLNGRCWVSMSASNGRDGNLLKTVFILAYLDAAAGDAWLDGEENVVDRMPNAATFGRMLTAVDQFYQAPENVRLPIVFALKVFGLKLRGTSQRDIDDVIVSMRQWLKTLDEKQKRPPYDPTWNK